MAEVTTASLRAVIGIFDVVGATVSGWPTDRVDSHRLLFAYYGLRGLSLLYLPAAFGSPGFGLILFIVFYGLDAAGLCLFMRRPGETGTATPLLPDAPLLRPAAAAVRR